MVSLAETPLTGEPDAGEPPVRFGGRGGAHPAIPTPIMRCRDSARRLGTRAMFAVRALTGAVEEPPRGRKPNARRLLPGSDRNFWGPDHTPLEAPVPPRPVGNDSMAGRVPPGARDAVERVPPRPEGVAAVPPIGGTRALRSIRWDNIRGGPTGSTLSSFRSHFLSPLSRKWLVTSDLPHFGDSQVVIQSTFSHLRHANDRLSSWP